MDHPEPLTATPEQAAAFAGPFMLDCGVALGSLTVAYRTYGALNADCSNAVLVCHYYTGTSRAARVRPGDPPGWWESLIGPGRAIDTERYYVVCMNTPSNVQALDPEVVTAGPDTLDPDGQLWGVQTIKADGGKLYAKGARRAGTFALLGEMQPGQPVIIVEGFATAATMREATGLPVAAAFDAGNLADVARALRVGDPARLIVLSGDNDHGLPRRDPPLPNVGDVKAHAAAAEVGGVVLLPSFPPGSSGTDWNDFSAQHGTAAVRTLAAAAASSATTTSTPAT